MDKQELIDKAINELKGIWPDKTGEENHLYRFYSGRFETGVYCTASSTPKHICTCEEFTQRARELGWVNGYQYGVEYETNGKKPDLDDDVIVDVSDGREWYGRSVMPVSHWRWRDMSFFKLMDERYKPKDHPAQPHDMLEKSWHERGELPPAGVECEWSDGGKIKNEIVKVIAYNGDFAWIKPKDGSPMTVLNPSGFRPIKSERERFVESAMEIYHKETSVDVNDCMAALFDAGFRAPSDKG